MHAAGFRIGWRLGLGAGLLVCGVALSGCGGGGEGGGGGDGSAEGDGGSGPSTASMVEPMTAAFAQPDERPLLPWPACVPSGAGTDYAVGPGQPLASLDQVPWERLAPGDTVRIHYSATPYRGKFLLAAHGTATRPVRVCGVRGPNGERPVIDGQGATTSPGLLAAFAGSVSDILQRRALVMVTKLASDAWTDRPTYLQIDGLKFTRAHPAYQFRDAAGAVKTYDAFGACIWVDRGDHVTIADNELTDCAMGVFSRSADDGSGAVTENLRLVGNVIHGNGVVGSESEHSTYTQGLGVVIEHNVYGPLRAGARGNAIKDRSAGLVVRYNRIEEGAHAIDLVEAEDFPLLVLPRADYRTTLVYGNQIRKDGDSGSVIHYGGDHAGSTPGALWGEPIFRKGVLQFFHNTVIVTGKSAEVFQLSTTEERAEVWNNAIVFASTVSEKSLRAGQSVGPLWVTGGVVHLGKNWLSIGWQDIDQWHTLTGQLLLAAAPLVGLRSPLVEGNWVPQPGSALVDAAGPAPAGVAAVPILWQLDAVGRSQARVTKGAAPDLGAVEQ
ncbi:right-handed parallel beta-helix repeat-containing protein [uncultured Sphaerotilus sp.]|uniref:right-handed parallel beta-helix repeat-containing protein n=1 Tax=uncultured Sphaerotilus sp. TaxID=474984 RepID=UPI0030CA505E